MKDPHGEVESSESGVLVIFCGIPGSGKTSIAREVARRVNGSFHIQTDVVRRMIHPPVYDLGESKMVYDMVSALGRRALEEGYFTILDGTFLRESYREEALQALKGLYTKSLIVAVECRLETALHRNSGRRAYVPKGKVKQFYERFERPSNGIVLNTDRLTVSEAASLVVKELSG